MNPRGLTVVISLSLLLGLGAVSLVAQEAASPPETLAQAVLIQSLQEQLLVAQQQATQCDAGWAATRQQLAQTYFATQQETTQQQRAALDAQAAAAGFRVDRTTADTWTLVPVVPVAVPGADAAAPRPPAAAE